MHTPSPILEHSFNDQRLPKRPYCCDDLSRGLRIRPLQQALQHRYIQLNRPDWTSWLIFDVDRPAGAFAWYDSNLPPPNWTTTSRSGHAHLVYGLSLPVFSGDERFRKPFALVEAIRRALGSKLGADQNYSGLITQNPLHPGWLTTAPERHRLYSLGDFLEWIDLSSPAQPKQKSAENGSRNCALFDRLRYAAYQHALSSRLAGLTEEAWCSFVLSMAESMNFFVPPLPPSEVRSIARSVSRWVWRRYTGRLSGEAFALRQSHRGQQKGKDRREQGIALLAAGVSPDQVMVELSASRATVYRWQSILRTSTAVVSKPDQISAPDNQPCRINDMSSQVAKQPCRVSDKSSQAAPVIGDVA
jgi:Replicase family/Primase C terminal 1 (PriCT-1)